MTSFIEKLRAAQKEPEKYRDLKVRVGGYEAYFVDLPGQHQELQIRRCEQYYDSDRDLKINLEAD